MRRPQSRGKRDHRQPSARPAANTSWEEVSGWYAGHVKKQHTLQDDLVYPGAFRLLAPAAGKSYLDIACGEGVFLRYVRERVKGARLAGFDAAPSLVDRARSSLNGAELLVADAMRFAEKYPGKRFDGAACLLAIQNIRDSAAVFRNAARVLAPGAPLVIVMNHPCFRIPRQSDWGWDEQKKWMFRRVDRYLTPMNIPILAHPGADRQQKTVSFHRPLSQYVSELAAAGFAVDALEEWVSPRESLPGARARAENAARAEFPLFLAVRARLMPSSSRVA